MPLQVISTAFTFDQTVPPKYTCDGENVSPPLAWTGVPDEAEALAVIVEDPDSPSGDFTHWLVYDLPANETGLPEGIARQREIYGHGRQGKNDFKQTGYGGPCPPKGSHRYVFRVFAYDSPLNLEPGATKEELLDALDGHVLAEGSLTGRYMRSS